MTLLERPVASVHENRPVDILYTVIYTHKHTYSHPHTNTHTRTNARTYARLECPVASVHESRPVHILFLRSYRFCAVTRERGVNIFRMTHDLLRSYSRMWRKHITCAMISFTTQKETKPTYVPRMWHKHIHFPV